MGLAAFIPVMSRFVFSIAPGAQHRRSRFVGILLLALLAAAGITSAIAQSPVLPVGTRFIMSHFKIEGTNQTEKLYISTSPNGTAWTPLNNGNPVWEPPNAAPFHNVVRDPSIVFANGFYWVAYTAGNYGYRPSFGLIKSVDLLNWTFVTDVSTHLPTAYDPFTWGPFFFKDTDGSVHIFVSIGEKTDPNTGQAIFRLRTYEVHPLNADFTQWSAPVLVQAPSDFINEFWVWREGDTYHAVYVDFRQNGRNVHVTSSNLITGWNTPQVLGLDGLEGAFVLKKPTGGYRVYVEGVPAYGYRYYDYSDAFTSPVGPTYVSSPITMRNGKVITAAATTTYADWKQLELPGLAENERAPLADADADGLKNIVECATGLPPAASTASALALQMHSSGALRLRYTHLGSIAGITLELEPSSSLDFLAPAPPASLRSSTMLSDGRELLEWHAPALTPPEARYFRLRATFTP